MKRVLGVMLGIAAGMGAVADDYGTIDWGHEGVANTDLVDRIVQVTMNPSNDWVQCWGTWPWSPDGREFAYTARKGPSYTYDEICVIGFDDEGGTSWRQLTFNDTCDTHASFTPDGKKIVFQRRDEETENATIWIMDKWGNNQTSLTAKHGGPMGGEDCGENKPMVSPNGDKIAFRSGKEETDDDAAELWVMNIDGSNPVRVSDPAMDCMNKHSWSPDGKWLLFTAKYPDFSRADLYKVRLDGSNLTLLTDTNDAICTTWSAFSPDGKKIGFRQRHYDTNIAKLSVMDADGSNVRDLIVTDETEVDEETLDWVCGPISWSPNSQWIQTKIWPDNTLNWNQIAIVNVESGEIIPLTYDYMEYRAWWSPDGKRILFRDRSWNLSRDNNANRDDLLVIEFNDAVPFAQNARVFGQNPKLANRFWNLDGLLTMQGNKWVAGKKGWTLEYGRDLDGDGNVDLLWGNRKNGNWKATVHYLNMNGFLKGEKTWSAPKWQAAALGDLNLDGRPDLVWQAPNGVVNFAPQKRNGDWGAAVKIRQFANAKLAGVGQGDALIAQANGVKPVGPRLPMLYLQQHPWVGKKTFAFSLDPKTMTLTRVRTYAHLGEGWKLKTVADLDGDGIDDLLWQGKLMWQHVAVVWLMNPDGTTVRETMLWSIGPGGWSWNAAGRFINSYFWGGRFLL